MSTNELALLIEIVRNISESGKTAFIWWIIGDKLIPAFVTFLIFAMGFAFFAFWVKKAFK